MNPSIDGKVIVITGASSGLGEAAARLLGAQGARLVLGARRIDRIQALADELQAKGIQARAIATDVTQCDQVRHLVDSAVEAFGRIDVMINNAGLSEFHAFGTQPAAQVEALMTTNLLSPILLSQKFLPMLQAQSSAQIVNIGSAFGDIGYPGFAAYCATKFGLRGFTQALRRELSDSAVRVRYFAPRATKTSINATAVDAMNDALKTHIDEPAVVAQAFVEFLAGPKNECVIGWPEKFYVFINRLRHQMTDQAIGKQLATIKRFLPN